ncbi:hypothetical protein [Cytophaga hutchinsonii]|jgi:uncharacterized membrane protein|uniref:Uncharacterized protein n=1 Tax=Cytophaga hutchinsonii (strain ATCC 33406 / DSM 1761 / CIP 103989 / NBRC 15051 / NCIMB 9469 / D465) TaxID=269798 RepID=A0A6N4SSH9_CYTH3|nr:hypothetical protein [Cytophaga hutchinsonii]ABG59333.1 hypothetical protein CHU_2070 [Cytophaga hutchinsonii ATCC 33406]SFX91997.1 hypothetical protein SAMN04487930_11326 [Cytophaga hutchinsonii ATCC 33406]
MNIKRIFGAALTVLGVGFLIYTAILFSGTGSPVKPMIIYGVLGFVFFLSGMGLIRTMNDAA